MKLDELTKMMETLSGKRDNKKQLRAIAHWLKKVKDSKGGVYRCYDTEDVPSLSKIAELKLIEVKEGDRDEKIGTVHAKLTKNGEELCKEFFKAGYFMKS